MPFDPYLTWLGITADRRPPTHYELLGLAKFESDFEVIERAALRRMSKIREHQIGPHGELSQEILAELARARLILIDPDRRAQYDAKLRAKGASVPDPAPDTDPDVATSPEAAKVRAKVPSLPALALALAPTPATDPDVATTPNEEALRPRDLPAEDSSDVFGGLSLEEPVGVRPGSLGTSVRTRRSWWKNPIAAGLFLASHALLLYGFVMYGFPYIAQLMSDETATSDPAALASAAKPKPQQASPGKPPPTARSEEEKPAVANSVFVFEGKTRFTIAKSDELAMAGRDYTVLARIKTAHGGTIWSKSTESHWQPDGKSFSVRNGKLAFDVASAGGLESHRPVADDHWHVVAATFTHANSEVILYVDGTPDAWSKLTPKEDPPGSVAQIGYSASGFPAGKSFFEGQIADARFYQRALSADEIGGRTAKLRAVDLPLARWNLRAVRGPLVADEMRHGHDGTIEVGEPTPALIAQGPNPTVGPAPPAAAPPADGGGSKTEGQARTKSELALKSGAPKAIAEAQKKMEEARDKYENVKETSHNPMIKAFDVAIRAVQNIRDLAPADRVLLRDRLVQERDHFATRNILPRSEWMVPSVIKYQHAIHRARVPLMKAYNDLIRTYEKAGGDADEAKIVALELKRLEREAGDVDLFTNGSLWEGVRMFSNGGTVPFSLRVQERQGRQFVGEVTFNKDVAIARVSGEFDGFNVRWGTDSMVKGPDKLWKFLGVVSGPSLLAEFQGLNTVGQGEPTAVQGIVRLELKR